ncbi:cytochrome c oxidase assembly protein [Microvirga sp. W0021]|uniref:Cytochrome c oxidase assembly protein CtaG n=1 Tax=Hohaiivirga grylli TaxID=3133970 RepID=A0ABV0BHC2_9HYPH
MDSKPHKNQNAKIALFCAGLAVAMVGAAYACVPLYDLFCRVTGFDGRPITSAIPSDKVLDRKISVRFDANVAPALSWNFTAKNPEVELRLGEVKTIYYTVRNTGSTPETGIATYNVQPDLAGSYFVKIQCFCFTEQVLQPGEEREEAVVFYVDPDLVKDTSIGDLQSITLSYTFFPSRNGSPVAAASEPKQSKL